MRVASAEYSPLGIRVRSDIGHVENGDGAGNLEKYEFMWDKR
jgi:hypothetical protein